MRPISVESIVGTSDAKPRFLSKKERQRLAEQRDAKTKRAAPAPMPRSKRQKPLPTLDHDEEEEYQPLVRHDTRKHIDPLSNLVSWSQKRLEDMTPRDWRLLRDDYNINVRGDDIPNPLRKWKESPLHPKLISLLSSLKYVEPTPIQRAAIPLALAQRDMVGIAETGSGKTLAFVLPLINYILSIDSDYLKLEHLRDDNHNKPLGLILAPTRELALQITKEALKFAEPLGLVVASIIGGHQYEELVHLVKDGVHIVVATPGRLVDSLERGIISLDKCYYFTMDEADKMIDMGFEKSLLTILTYLPQLDSLASSPDASILHIQRRVTLMFTATITPAIEKITRSYLENPGHITIGDPNEVLDRIDQHFEYTEETDDAARIARVVKELGKRRGELVIVFANFKKTCETIAEELEAKGYNNVVIHGSKSQDLRERALESFRDHHATVLVATDVAARGIDVPDVALVINYQMPKKFEEYIHRIGRTGRAGKSGASLSFVDDGDGEIYLPLRKFLNRGHKRIPDWLVKKTLNHSNS